MWEWRLDGPKVSLRSGGSGEGSRGLEVSSDGTERDDRERKNAEDEDLVLRGERTRRSCRVRAAAVEKA